MPGNKSWTPNESERKKKERVGKASLTPAPIAIVTMLGAFCTRGKWCKTIHAGATSFIQGDW